MNGELIAMLLTPALVALIVLETKNWMNPDLAPPALVVLGDIGNIYHMLIMLVVVGAWVSILSLLLFGQLGWLPKIGMLILGYFAGAALVLLTKNTRLFTLLFCNLFSPGVLSVNLFVIHIMAWVTSPI